MNQDCLYRITKVQLSVTAWDIFQPWMGMTRISLCIKKHASTGIEQQDKFVVPKPVSLLNILDVMRRQCINVSTDNYMHETSTILTKWLPFGHNKIQNGQCQFCVSSVHGSSLYGVFCHVTQTLGSALAITVEIDGNRGILLDSFITDSYLLVAKLDNCLITLNKKQSFHHQSPTQPSLLCKNPVYALKGS